MCSYTYCLYPATKNYCYIAIDGLIEIMSTRGPDPKVSDEELLNSLENGERPFSTVTTVTDQVSLSRERVRQRLNRLHEQEQIQREQISDSVVLYWVLEPSSPDK